MNRREEITASCIFHSRSYCECFTFTQTTHQTTTKCYTLKSLAMLSVLATAAIASIRNMQWKRNFRHFKRFIWLRIAYDTVRIELNDMNADRPTKMNRFGFIVSLHSVASSSFHSIRLRFNVIVYMRWGVYIFPIKWTMVCSVMWMNKEKKNSWLVTFWVKWLLNVSYSSATMFMRTGFFRPPWVTMRKHFKFRPQPAVGVCDWICAQLWQQHLSRKVIDSRKNSLILPVVSKENVKNISLFY